MNKISCLVIKITIWSRVKHLIFSSYSQQRQWKMSTVLLTLISHRLHKPFSLRYATIINYDDVHYEIQIVWVSFFFSSFTPPLIDKWDNDLWRVVVSLTISFLFRIESCWKIFELSIWFRFIIAHHSISRIFVNLVDSLFIYFILKSSSSWSWELMCCNCIWTMTHHAMEGPQVWRERWDEIWNFHGNCIAHENMNE